ncbi:hypothetical protein VTP01DRAFT_8623 [Rhizomucor pusillus]|uniref:uncharacterized protein n=1 Tax=Rhizomucor pusillus TaxID=4840 RepID=UPI0037449560
MLDTHVEKVIDETIANLDGELRALSLQIHDNPELGNHEYHASNLLVGYLEEKGFKMTRGVAGLPTAFIAEYSNGSQGRRVGFCSEYDALPGVGHACGHNLIAIGGVACAMATKALLERNLIQGTCTLFGTPNEEGSAAGNGKIVLVNSGEIQKRTDFCLMLHPAPFDIAFGRGLALDCLNIEFFGRASHAGMAPWEGVNALDALMQGWNNVSMLRQQILPTDRLHGFIKDGGKSANVIPAHASAVFYARSSTRARLAQLKVLLENCFKGAAKATGCEVKLQWAPYGAVDDIFPNEALAECYKSFMEEEGVQFLPRETEENLPTDASSDFGNITYVRPSFQPAFKIKTWGANHTKEFAKAAGTPEAHQSTLRASRCVAKTAASVFLSDELYESAWAAFKKGTATA